MTRCRENLIMLNKASESSSAVVPEVVMKPEVTTDEYAAVDMQTLWTAWALLAKVGEGQAVLKKEATITSVALENAMLYNKLRLVPLTRGEADKLVERDIEGAVDLALERVPNT